MRTKLAVRTQEVLIFNIHKLNLIQQLLKEEGSKFCRGSVRVCYGRSATLLDAANYAKEVWNYKNNFIKANLRISLDSTVTDTFDNNKLLKHFNNFNITAIEKNINEFVAIDEESSHLFQEEILEEANRFL